MNTFGHILKLSTFGESHGPAIGAVLDGFPSGISLDFDFITSENTRRKPGSSSITTERKEEDEPEFISGIFENVSTGAPIAFIIKNKDSKSQDYDSFKELYRPSHADFTYQQKYGIRDYRGGGRASARETACRVTAGALAKLILKELGITIHAFVHQVGNIKCEIPYSELDLNNTEKNAIRCPDLETANKMIALIEQIRDEGDSIGGTIFCVIKNPPIGLGSPIYAKLQADLASAMLGINAAKGFDYGSGFENLHQKGSVQNDEFIEVNNLIKTKTNHSGGIQGGISNGNDIYFRVAFKPVSTIKKEQNTVDQSGNSQIIKAEGRHDPCVLPRAVPIVEAMAALVLADHWLMNKTSKFNNI